MENSGAKVEVCWAKTRGQEKLLAAILHDPAASEEPPKKKKRAAAKVVNKAVGKTAGKAAGKLTGVKKGKNAKTAATRKSIVPRATRVVARPISHGMSIKRHTTNFRKTHTLKGLPKTDAAYALNSSRIDDHNRPATVPRPLGIVRRAQLPKIPMLKAPTNPGAAADAMGALEEMQVFMDIMKSPTEFCGRTHAVKLHKREVVRPPLSPHTYQWINLPADESLSITSLMERCPEGTERLDVVLTRLGATRGGRMTGEEILDLVQANALRGFVLLFEPAAIRTRDVHLRAFCDIINNCALICAPAKYDIDWANMDHAKMRILLVSSRAVSIPVAGLTLAAELVFERLRGVRGMKIVFVLRSESGTMVELAEMDAEALFDKAYADPQKLHNYFSKGENGVTVLELMALGALYYALKSSPYAFESCAHGTVVIPKKSVDQLPEAYYQLLPDFVVMRSVARQFKAVHTHLTVVDGDQRSVECGSCGSEGAIEAPIKPLPAGKTFRGNGGMLLAESWASEKALVEKEMATHECLQLRSSEVGNVPEVVDAFVRKANKKLAGLGVLDKDQLNVLIAEMLCLDQADRVRGDIESRMVLK